jgi:hypothetical protein
MGFLFGDPDWQLTEEEPLAVLWFAPEGSG